MENLEKYRNIDWNNLSALQKERLFSEMWDDLRFTTRAMVDLRLQLPNQKKIHETYEDSIKKLDSRVTFLEKKLKFLGEKNLSIWERITGKIKIPPDPK